MKGPYKRARWWLSLGGLVSTSVLPGVLIGCVSTDTNCSGGTCKKPGWFGKCQTIPKGAIPQPYGWFVHGWENAQCAKAEADDFVIYKHEWFKGGTELGPYGTYHIQQILKRLPGVPFPVLIQFQTQDPAKNEMRRMVIVNYLAQAGVPDPDTRVVLGYPEAEGLYGDEATRIYQQMISQHNLLNQFGGLGGGFGGLNFAPGLGGGFGGTGFNVAPVAPAQNLP
jgi:hypothetical protein